MNAAITHRLIVLLSCGLLSVSASRAVAKFVNSETPPVHPIELSPDGQTLAVCNLPDNRIELFNAASGIPQWTGSILVGHDPVSARFFSSNEVWVVNHISSSISIVDLQTRQVMATIQTKAGPADVVFAGTPKRAYVSCSKEDTVQVFDPQTRTLVTELSISGDRPKALATSLDGSRVYVAIFESGNASTILAPKLTKLDQTPPPSVVSDPEGPHRGQDPPPNSGSSFHPPLSPYLVSNSISRGSLIVKKNDTGHWLDDNGGDWTEFISGSKAARSGRISGWGMPDRDLAVIDTTTHAITYASRLMNICMAVGVNPANGQVAVVGTDAKNEIRFEPNLRGKFLRVQLALVDPLALTNTLHDLNPHLDYTTASVSPSERAKSLGDPRGVVWNSAGTRAYITGMGSRNLVVIDGTGHRIQNDAIEVGEGPTGLALDEPRGRLYVLNRFGGSISVVDTSSLTNVATVRFFDPTPEFIKVGRRLFYDTRLTSGSGHVSCASCHVDVRVDRLAWDLGIPDGDMAFGPGPDDPVLGFAPGRLHPMKGPMVTLTMQDIVNIRQAGPGKLHWRGDRDSILDFHVTFTDLLAADQLPTVTQMRELQLFLGSVRFPPNRHRNMDNTLPEGLPLPGHYGLVNSNGVAMPLPNGNAVLGLDIFLRREFPVGPQAPPPLGNPTINCFACHDCESFSSQELPVIPLLRSDGLAFRSPSLRSVSEKVGMNQTINESRAGFGFMHDGRADTLTRFLVDGFGFDNNQDIADMVAFLLSISGGDFPFPCSGDSQHRVQDAHAAVGRQVALTSSELTDELLELIALTEIDSPPKAIDLIVCGRQNGTNRTWSNLQSDRNGEVWSLENILALASVDSPLTFTAVVRGSGRRLGVDRDDDGIFDRTEQEQGSDPFDIRSPSNLPSPTAPLESLLLAFYTGEFVNLQLDVAALDSQHDGQTGEQTGLRHPNRRIRFSIPRPEELPLGISIDSAGENLVWQVPQEPPQRLWRTHLQVMDNGRPTPEEIPLELRVLDLKASIIDRDTAIRLGQSQFFGFQWQFGFPAYRYEIQVADSPAGPWRRLAFVHERIWTDGTPFQRVPRRFYRIVASR